MNQSASASPFQRQNGQSNEDLFHRMSGWTIRVSGGRWGFLTALSVVIIWAILGPFLRYSDEWQLVINTGTTIVTFLMVFLIQSAQNRESKAIHLKLDELIRAVKPASNEMIRIEQLTESQLDNLAQRYHKIAQRYHQSAGQNNGTEAEKHTGDSAQL